MFKFTGVLREQQDGMVVDGYVEALMEIGETMLPVLVKQSIYDLYLNKTIRANSILSGSSLSVEYASETNRGHDKRCPLVGIITSMGWETLSVAVVTVRLPDTDGEVNCRCFDDVALAVMSQYNVGDTINCKGYFKYVDSSSTLIFYVKKVGKGEKENAQ